MLFDPKDLDPGYTVEEIEKLFFIRRDLSDFDEAEKQLILRKVNSLGLKDLRLETVHVLLCVMHEAREIDQTHFINDVFLPWCGLRNRTKPHYERIGRELSRIGEFVPGSTEEAAHVVNVYRNIVSDLFDPYLSLVVACFQFKEGKFTNMEAADVGQGERSKYDYLLARVRGVYSGRDTFLSGYDPRVRNAISHSGSRGIVYLADRVQFKNIKREVPPKAETVVWAFDELQFKTLQLLECITSVEVVSEIFGLDCTSIIEEDFKTYMQFVQHAVTAEDKAVLQARHGALLESIRASKHVPLIERLDALSKLLFYNCKLRNLPCRGVKVASEKSAVCIEVPLSAIDATDDQRVLERAHSLLHYAILGRSAYGTLFDWVLVEETDDSRARRQLFVQVSGKDLDAWIEEGAGLVDLLKDSRWFLNGQRVGVQVDFDALQAIEQQSVNSEFPRKDRSGQA